MTFGYFYKIKLHTLASINRQHTKLLKCHNKLIKMNRFLIQKFNWFLPWKTPILPKYKNIKKIKSAKTPT